MNKVPVFERTRFIIGAEQTAQAHCNNGTRHMEKNTDVRSQKNDIPNLSTVPHKASSSQTMGFQAFADARGGTTHEHLVHKLGIEPVTFG